MAFKSVFCLKNAEINPINLKARSIPILNPFDAYGRVFFFSWFGFFIAFWSWYAFPPLLADVIAGDVKMTPDDVKNSNIVSLIATLLVRFTAGPLCDRFGPRITFVGTLIVGAIPTFCAGGAFNKSGILAIRFFVGILGGSFVPCQVWSTSFFDKNVVGTANAIVAGLGNAGGGITYFVMPAIFNSLVQKQYMTPHTAWRVSFVVPGILIICTAIAMLLTCSDCPEGKWSERGTKVGMANSPDSAVTMEKDAKEPSADSPTEKDSPSGSDSPTANRTDSLKKTEEYATTNQLVDSAKGEVIRKPTIREMVKVCTSLQSLTLAACYLCTFGAELSINSILGNYYTQNFKLSLQNSGNWAAMFGLLNVIFRPLGGFVSDVAYRATGNVWAKKILLHIYGFIMAIFLIVIGKLNPQHPSTLYGLIAGLAFFLEGANGLNFALVPHVHPFANGIVSGLTGASGNLGGIFFSIVFRYRTIPESFWILGVITICLNALFLVVPPIPKGQVGGR